MFAAFHCSETSIFWICAKWVPMQSLGDAVQHFRSLPEFFTASRQKDTWNIGYWESLWNPIICGSPSSNQNTIDFAAASSRCRLSTSANIQPCRLQVLQCVCVCARRLVKHPSLILYVQMFQVFFRLFTSHPNKWCDGHTLNSIHVYNKFGHFSSPCLRIGFSDVNSITSTPQSRVYEIGYTPRNGIM